MLRFLLIILGVDLLLFEIDGLILYNKESENYTRGEDGILTVIDYKMKERLGNESTMIGDESTVATYYSSSTMNNSSIPSIDDLKYSIFRIQAVQSEFDFLQPFSFAGNGVGLGSGFAVKAEDDNEEPLIITNSHVVVNSEHIEVQLLVYSSKPFPAKVVTICPHFDIAILKLQNFAEFKKALGEKGGMTWKTLTLAGEGGQKGNTFSSLAKMGEPVIAMGFPLGQNLLKLAAGEIAGNQEVEGNICIQSTAPISPGNSGGPLLLEKTLEVIGINFAKAATGENINFVIPAWRVRQIINKYLEDKALITKKDEKVNEKNNGVLVVKTGKNAGKNRKKIRTEEKRIHLKIPIPRLRTTVGEAVYDLDPACEIHKGVLVTDLDPRSFLLNASPPLEVGSYLISIDGASIDQFSQGRKTYYLEDQVGYENLFYMRKNLFADFTFESCSNGRITEHTSNLRYSPTYDRGIKMIVEPNFEKIEYEVFGDISVMDLTANHIQQLTAGSNHQQQGVSSLLLSRLLTPKEIIKQRVIINYVKGGSEAEKTLQSGMVIQRVNGCMVSNLAEFRQHFIPKVAREGKCGRKKLAEEKPVAAAISTPEAIVAAPVVPPSPVVAMVSKSSPSEDDMGILGKFISMDGDIVDMAQDVLHLSTGKKKAQAQPEADSEQMKKEQNKTENKTENKKTFPTDNIFSIETDLGVFYVTQFQSTLEDQLKSQFMISDTLIGAGKFIGIISDKQKDEPMPTGFTAEVTDDEETPVNKVSESEETDVSEDAETSDDNVLADSMERTQSGGHIVENIEERFQSDNANDQVPEEAVIPLPEPTALIVAGKKIESINVKAAGPILVHEGRIV